MIFCSTEAGQPANSQLLVALRYLATGTSINSLEQTNALHSSQGSVENYIKNVAAALNSLAQDEVCFEFDPNTIGTTKQDFADYEDSWLVSGH